MLDKLGRWPTFVIVLEILALTSRTDVSAQATEPTGLSNWSGSAAGDQSASSAEEGQEASDISQRFTEHLDRNMPALLLITLIGALSTAAGVGGGALFVPVFNSLLDFTVKDAAVISQAIITGGAIAGASFALFQVHPLQPDKPLIDFDLALLLIPSLLLGTSIGVLMNHMFPVWFITILLVCLLTYLARRTLQKGLKLYRAECNAKADNNPELDLVQIHQISVEGEHALPVQNLKPSRFEEPNTPNTAAASKLPCLQTAAEGHKQESSTCGNPGQRVSASAKPQEVSLAILSSAEASPAQLRFADTLLDKSVHLSSAASHGSLQSLRIRTEADSDSIAPSMAEDTLQTNPSAVLLDTQLSTSFGHDSALSPATSSGSVEDSAPLLPKTSFVQGAATHEPQDVGPAGMLAKETSPQQQCTGPVQQPGLPMRKCLAAGGMWVAFAALQVTKSQLRACSPGYWVVYIIQAFLLLAASLFFVKKACTNQRQRVAADSATHTVCLDQSTRVPSVLVRASAIAVGGGALASTIGMGGAVIMGPLLLSLQIHPLVTAATSTLMLLFSSSAATLSFAVAGSINTEYALIYGMCNLMSSLAGVFLIGRVVRRTGKSAVIVLLLACIMAAGACASAVFGGRESLRNFQTGSNLTFSSICN